MVYIGSLPLVFSNKLCRLQPPMCDGQGCVLSCFSYIELFEKEVRLHRTVRLLPVCVCLHGGASVHSSGQDTDVAFLSILRRLEKRYQAVVLGKKMFFDLSGLYFAF